MAKDPICGMSVDGKTGLKLTHKGETYFFCSAHCREKFAKEKMIPPQEVAACPVTFKRPFYKNKTFIVASSLILLAISSYVLPFLEPFRKSLLMYFKTIWWAVLLGLTYGDQQDRARDDDLAAEVPHLVPGALQARENPEEPGSHGRAQPAFCA